jgi:ComF family protein
MSRALSEFVESWIGLSKPVAEAALQRAAFVADPPEEYCARCGESSGPGEAGADGCASCRRGPAVADRVVRLGRYAPPLKDWIAGIKYEGWTEMAEVLGRLLGDRVRESMSSDSSRTLVVPVPMPWQRRIYRGLDHARMIAEAVARQIERPIIPVLAKRHGEPQANRTRSERTRSRKDWIRARRRIGGWNLRGLDVILVDDVRTTGTTLRTCVRVLRGLGAASATVAVLAVADSPARRSSAPAAALDVSL